MIVGTSTTIGFGALGSNSSLASPSYLADVSFGGASNSIIRILKLGTPNTTIATASSPNLLATEVTYTLSLVGDYTSSGLDLTLTLDNGTTQTVINGIDATPLTGQWFGFRNRTNNASGGALTASYDNFSLVIPEPASAALLAVGTLLLMVRQRKISRHA